MRYLRRFCSNCKDYTLHFGTPQPIHCMRHTADEEIESQISKHEFETKTESILRTAVDWTFSYIERKEREAENVVA